MVRPKNISRIAPLVVLILGPSLAAQIRVGTVRGTVLDPTGAAVSGALVRLSNRTTGFQRQTSTGPGGAFHFNNLPFDPYLLRVEATGFQPWNDPVRVRSNLPVQVEASLSLTTPTETIRVEAMVESDTQGLETDLDQSFIERQPGAQPSAGLQEVIATVAGWSSEDNGLLHVRGVDDGFLFLIDGIPLTDRTDRLFAGSPQTEMIQSLQVINGHLPVEYGNASGAVVHLTPKSGIDRSLGGSVSLAGGNFQSGQAGYTLAGGLGGRLGFFLAHSLAGSGQRYLDPVDPGNFNNRGWAQRLDSRLDWHPSARDILVANLSGHGSRFRVTNTRAQEQAGQRQRQRLDDNHQSFAWQRNWSPYTTTNLGGYRRFFRSELIPSANDLPVSASQRRRHLRTGILLNLTHWAGGHTLKAGADAQRVAPREFFSFFVTDEEFGEEVDLSDLALEFDRENPFLFQERAVRGQGSVFLQDTFSLGRNLTINAGVRFDHTAVMVSAAQVSPRAGAAFLVPYSQTVLRASYNRLFMPPQIENLLLSSSEQARRLSPFATPEGMGGARVAPERQHAFEVGFGQPFGDWFQLNAAYWWRLVRNYADPNVFLGTTVIFPNSVAEGKAQGLEARIDFPQRRGWSGYLSYSNARVFQVGPINGGLFLEEEVIEIGPGTKFNPDHDQRNTGGFGMIYEHPSGFWVGLSGRHESGAPLEVELDELDELRERPGAELVNFERGRVKPRTLFDFSLGKDFFSERRITLRTQFDIRNLANRPFAYNFGNPFSGTHFGHPRMWSGRIRIGF